MDRKKAKKHKKDGKTVGFYIRFSEEEAHMLEELYIQKDMSKADVIRRGIKMQYNIIANMSNGLD